jgi:hypothetical protein
LGIMLFLARLLSLDEALIEAAHRRRVLVAARAVRVLAPDEGVIEFYVVVSVITMLSGLPTST